MPIKLDFSIERVKPVDANGHVPFVFYIPQVKFATLKRINGFHDYDSYDFCSVLISDQLFPLLFKMTTLE